MKLHQIIINNNNNKEIAGFLLDQSTKLKNLYFDLDYHLYNNTEIESIIQLNFDGRVLKAYKTLNAYAQKADLAKLCLLYVYGGYYFDLAICPEHKFDFFNHDMVLVRGIAHKIHTCGLPVVENNFLYVKHTQHPLIKAMIDHVVSNIEKLNFGIHPLDITAPIALGRVLELEQEKHNITWAGVELDNNEEKYTVIDNKPFYRFKPKKYDATIENLGVTGTNQYDKLWFEGKSFKINFSYIMLTNNPADKERKTKEKICIQSVLTNMDDDDEFIVVGDVSSLSYLANINNVKLVDKSDDAHHKRISAMRNFGVRQASNYITINLDNDIVLPKTFRKNLVKYYNENHKDFDTLNTKVYLPDGGRCWDRSVYNPSLTLDENVRNGLQIVPYDYVGNNCWYDGPFVIRKKHIALNVPYNEQILLRQGEEIDLSMRLVSQGYKIKIDQNNFVFHFDDTLKHVKIPSNDGSYKEIVRRLPLLESDTVVKNSELRNMFVNLIKEYLSECK